MNLSYIAAVKKLSEAEFTVCRHVYLRVFFSMFSRVSVGRIVGFIQLFNVFSLYLNTNAKI